MASPARAMRLALATALLVATLAACGGPPAETAEQATPARASESAVGGTAVPSPAPAPSLVEPNGAIADLDALGGEYRVAGAGGREIDLPHAITARIDDTGIIVDSGCVQLSWVLFFDGPRLVTEQLFPRASCGRALLPEEEAIVAAMNGASAITRTPANGIEIGGEDGVLLFSQ